MTASSSPHSDRVAARDSLWALALILGVIGVVVACVFMFANAACGCTKPADLVVVNRSATPAVIEWHLGDGLFGTSLLRVSGKIEAPACRTSTWELTRGAIDTTTTVGGQAHEATFSVGGDRSTPGGWIQISAEGEVTDATWASSPVTPSEDASLCP